MSSSPSQHGTFDEWRARYTVLIPIHAILFLVTAFAETMPGVANRMSPCMPTFLFASFPAFLANEAPFRRFCQAETGKVIPLFRAIIIITSEHLAPADCTADAVDLIGIIAFFNFSFL